VRYFVGLLCILAIFPAALHGQSSEYVAVTPNVANLVVGQSQRFRLVDQNGRPQHNVSWTLSEKGASMSHEGDDLVLTATAPASFQIMAVSPGGSAQASVKVIAEKVLPTGSIKWSAPSPEGCKTTQIVPAVPSASGIDVYESSHCPDGEYVSAYTDEGILVWRHKVSGPTSEGVKVIPTFNDGPPLIQRSSTLSRLPSSSGSLGASSATSSSRAGISLASVCDAIAVGTAREKVQEVLKSRNLSFTSEGQVWVVEESTARCKLWFDDKSSVAKKSKTLVAD
jgi:hypothetical protein